MKLIKKTTILIGLLFIILSGFISGAEEVVTV